MLLFLVTVLWSMSLASLRFLSPSSSLFLSPTRMVILSPPRLFSQYLSLGPETNLKADLPISPHLVLAKQLHEAKSGNTPGTVPYVRPLPYRYPSAHSLTHSLIPCLPARLNLPADPGTSLQVHRLLCTAYLYLGTPYPIDPPSISPALPPLRRTHVPPSHYDAHLLTRSSRRLPRVPFPSYLPTLLASASFHSNPILSLPRPPRPHSSPRALASINHPPTWSPARDTTNTTCYYTTLTLPAHSTRWTSISNLPSVRSASVCKDTRRDNP
ncbi:hypothetical protein LX32DRAFT_394599 [Colletotrichum zoysiae]|uniref:Uncharacterized protein n=1 Tax=Colletotrichum zoysiae TaxID=1216348 RepID=A0AAD9HI75_9PEZI|nr:hypothetical protein LX32DRAFT_394599 [Colletotrichum zoysiae]